MLLVLTLSDFRRAMRIGPRAFPGLYDVLFHVADSTTLCHSCITANRRRVLEAIAAPNSDDEWRVVAVDTAADHDGPVLCGECGVALLPDPAEALSERDVLYEAANEDYPSLADIPATGCPTEIWRDNVRLATVGGANAAFAWIARHSPHSVSHSLRYEGFRCCKAVAS